MKINVELNLMYWTPVFYPDSAFIISANRIWLVRLTSDVKCIKLLALRLDELGYQDERI